MRFKKINVSDGIKKSSDALCEWIAWCLIILFGFAILSYAFLGRITRGELESNEYPIISIQYRGSIFLKESDIEYVQKDFPQLRAYVESLTHPYQRILQVGEESWYYYYFPIYPLLCLPLKLLFQFLRIDQERCFTVTNALLTILALCFVQRKLNVSAKQRLLAVTLLMVSPLVYNVNFIYYMAFMASFVTMSLVLYCNKRYKSSALLLSIAGISNPTIMAVGFVMIAEYLVNTARQCKKGKKWKRWMVKTFLLRMVGYGLCYIPCLIPFVVNRAAHLPTHWGLSIIGNGIRYWPARFLMYLFDPSVGFGTFAPVAIIMFLVLVVVGVVRRKLRVLIWAGFLLGTVAAFSLMFHINCGMVFCARYIIFTWPIISIFMATDGFDILKPVTARRIVYPVIILSCVFLLFVNRTTSSYGFSRTTQWILKNAPQLYAPYSATFYCRTLHVDGAYNITDPAYYLDPQTDEVRKLIYKADEGQAAKVLNDLTGNSDSVAYLAEKLEKNGTDGEYHYVSFPASGKYQVREKSPEEKGELVNAGVVVEEHDLVLGQQGVGTLASMPFTIKENTTYKIEIELAEDIDFDDAVKAEMGFDFYAGSVYDRVEQQVSDFAKEGRYDYCFYLDSGDMDNEMLDGYFRLFIMVDPGGSLDVEMLRVTEMERVG